MKSDKNVSRFKQSRPSRPFSSAAVALIPPHTTVLRRNAESGTCSRFSIIGTYADTDTHFVSHVAILRSGIEVNGLTQCPVFQCCPPIIAGEVTLGLNSESHTRSESTDVIADIDLDLDEQAMIETWLSGVDRENYEFSGTSFHQYHLFPHMKYAETETGRKIRRRFSCAGFVLEAYRSAEIDLIKTDADSTGNGLPIVDEAMLRRAYPGLVWVVENPRVHGRFSFRGLPDLGLEPGGMWRLLLPAYLFHSTVRASAENRRPFPYKPESSAEAEYPRESREVTKAIHGSVPTKPFGKSFK